MSGDVWLNEMITVCDQCFMACCWQGIFMCDNARDAGTVKKSRQELIALNLEHHCYMKSDQQLMEGK